VIHAKDAEQVPHVFWPNSIRMRTVSDAVLGLGLDYGVVLMLWDAGDK
jgi:hypothetical protein